MASTSSRPPTLTGLLRKAAEDSPEKRALSFAGKFEISHSRLQELIDHSASVLRSAGISPGDVVTLTFPNSIELVIMFLAVIRARGVAAPLNPAYTQEEFQFYLSDSKLLLTDPNGNPSAQAAASKLGITQATVSLPDPTGPVHISVPTLDGDSTHDLVHDFSNDPSDVALLLPTSGITGRHKVVPLTQHNLAASVQNIMSVYRFTDSDSTVAVLPLFHVHGLLAGLLSPLSAGGSVTLPSQGWFSASTFWADMRATNATWYTAVPTLHQILLDRHATKPEQDGLPKLRFIRSCSASLAPAILKRLESAFNAPVLEAYAKTEASHLICSNPLPQDGPHKPGSVGKPVGQELTILDDKGVPQPVGVIGEVCIRGTNVTKGYKNKAAFLFGWFHTGDLGYLDEDGYLYLLGRVKGQINTAGSSRDHIAVDVGAPISEGPDQNTGRISSFETSLPEGPGQNTGRISSFETSLPEGPDQNTGNPGDGLGPTGSYWIRWLVPLDALNFVSNAMAGVFVNSFPGDLTDAANLIINRLNGNGIRQLVFLASCNLFSNALVGINYLPGELQDVHETSWRAQLIASVGAPIAVAVFTLLSSFRFSSDPEGWSNWITELSRVNTALIGGGPLAFYWMRNPGTEN